MFVLESFGSFRELPERFSDSRFPFLSFELGRTRTPPLSLRPLRQARRSRATTVITLDVGRGFSSVSSTLLSSMRRTVAAAATAPSRAAAANKPPASLINESGGRSARRANATADDSSETTPPSGDELTGVATPWPPALRSHARPHLSLERTGRRIRGGRRDAFRDRGSAALLQAPQHLQLCATAEHVRLSQVVAGQVRVQPSFLSARPAGPAGTHSAQDTSQECHRRCHLGLGGGQRAGSVAGAV
eukprot:ctg_1921.g398